MEFGSEECFMMIMKISKIGEKKENIRSLEGKENYKYLEILEADTIKQTEIREKIRKNTLEEQENFSKLSCAAEISSKR